MTELFHRGYNPRTLSPEFTTWFDFVAAEGDATALEAECLGRFRDWFVMLATTRMTKSFKMVLLRVLLDNDAVFSGMPIPELAAKCRSNLLRRLSLASWHCCSPLVANTQEFSLLRWSRLGGRSGPVGTRNSCRRILLMSCRLGWAIPLLLPSATICR